MILSNSSLLKNSQSGVTVCSNLQAGLTLVELIVTVGLFATIFAFSQINISGLIAQTSVREQATTIASDLRRQQHEAMTGTSNPAGVRVPTGVHFDEYEYVLFYGTEYDEQAVDVFSISLAPHLRFVESSLANDAILFEPMSGECGNCLADQNTILLESEASGERYQLTTNQYGVVMIEQLAQ
ncbi:MAG: hypothetical protein WDZ94_01110 [Patescibacteria group bacterium]